VSNRNTRTPLIASLYEQYLDNQDSGRFIRKVTRAYTPGTLERLATHPQRSVRRAAVLALGFCGNYEVNPTLGRAMLDEDRTVRMLAENAIRNVWTRSGNRQQRQCLGNIIRLCAAQHYDEAIRRATALVEEAPWLAEAWNQRAQSHFHQLRFAEAIRDAHQALEINPYHFVAATTMGQSYLEMGNRVSALESFRRALRLNPDLEGVRAQVVRLARIVEGK
jgi:tetratricopeptide (TPR) repeat protein